MMTEGANVFVCRIAQDYGRMLLNLAYSRLGSREDAEDCVQEDFVDDINTHVLPRYDHCYGPVRVPVTESQLLTASCSVPLDCGTVEQIRVGAGFVELCMDTRLPDSGDTHAAAQTQTEAITAALADAAVTFTDGHTETIAAMPSPWASAWVYANGEPDSCRVQHILSRMLDLREVESITLGGTVIALK